MKQHEYLERKMLCSKRKKNIGWKSSFLVVDFVLFSPSSHTRPAYKVWVSAERCKKMNDKRPAYNNEMKPYLVVCCICRFFVLSFCICFVFFFALHEAAKQRSIQKL